jgi:hypothetical protein
MCFALHTFPVVLHTMAPSDFNGIIASCSSEDGVLHLVLMGFWPFSVTLTLSDLSHCAEFIPKLCSDSRVQ